MSFMEYVNKQVLKECGITDFKLTEDEVKRLDYYRGNFLSTYYIALILTITLVLMVILNVLIYMGTINFSLEVIVNVRNFLAIATINAILIRVYYEKKYKKEIEQVAGLGLDKQLIKIVPYNCVRFAKGKFIMLDKEVVDTINAGEVNINAVYKESNELLIVKLTENKKSEDIKCTFTYDPLSKGMTMNLEVGARYYKEFHEFCLNGGTPK